MFKSVLGCFELPTIVFGLPTIVFALPKIRHAFTFSSCVLNSLYRMCSHLVLDDFLHPASVLLGWV